MPKYSLQSATLSKAKVLEFSPAELFQNNEVGAWYDPSDFSTLYQDSAGTTPVTALGQPVGLMLDKSQGGKPTGPELVTNGDFSSGTTGWNGLLTNSTLSVDAGSLKAEPVVNGGYGASSAITCVVGRSYMVQADVDFSAASAPSANFRVGSNGDLVAGVALSIVSGGVESLSGIFVATATTMYVGANDTGDVGTNYIKLDNVSIREIPGNHAAQATAAARPTVQARVNLATPSNASGYVSGLIFGSASTYPTLTSGVSDPFGGNDAYEAAGSNFVRLGTEIGTSNTVSITGDATISMWVRLTSGSASDINLRQRSETTADISSATLSSLGVDSTWKRISLTSTRNAANGDSGWYLDWGSGATTIEIYGIQFELGSTATTYQRVTTATDYQDIGLPRYLEFDGVDDAMATQSVDFTGTDEMTVCAGVYKEVDGTGSTVRILAELSPLVSSNNGSFVFTIFNGFASPDLQGEFVSRGTSNVTASTTSSAYAAPFTGVYTGTADISADEVALRVNASEVGTSTGDQGSGNYGDHSLFIGARNQASFFLDGRIHQLIVRGKTTSDNQLIRTERYVAYKTGVTL